MSRWHAYILGIIFMIPCQAMAAIWTEDFSDGFGRLSSQRDFPGLETVWNAEEEAIDGRTYRTITTGARYSPIPAVTTSSGVLAFSTEITPLAASGSSGIRAGVTIGIFDSDSDVVDRDHISITFGAAGSDRVISLRGAGEEGGLIGGPAAGTVPFRFGQRYFISTYAHLQRGLAIAKVFERSDESDTVVGQLQVEFDGSTHFSMDALGVWNGNRISSNLESPFDFRLHSISLIASSFGDMDNNGVVDAFDVDEFEMALSFRSEYLQRYSGVDPDIIGDLDGNGIMDAFDVDDFEQLLAGNQTAVPEPSTTALLFGIAMTLLALYPKRHFPTSTMRSRKTRLLHMDSA